MTTSSDRSISIVETARMIFRTAAPSDKQIHYVYERMKSGALKVQNFGGSPLKWTTTEAALAEFLADHRLSHATEKQIRKQALSRTYDLPDELVPVRSTSAEEESEQLRTVYHTVWRDYFLAVMLRRRMHHRSRNFQRAVLAGQVVMLCLFVVLIVGGLRISIVSIPPERRAIERFLAENTDDFKVLRWYPSQSNPQGSGLLVEVDYRYTKESRRAIFTTRTFLVDGEEVREQ